MDGFFASKQSSEPRSGGMLWDNIIQKRREFLKSLAVGVGSLSALDVLHTIAMNQKGLPTLANAQAVPPQRFVRIVKF